MSDLTQQKMEQLTGKIKEALVAYHSKINCIRFTINKLKNIRITGSLIVTVCFWQRFKKMNEFKNQLMF